MSGIRSDGSTASYYELPEGATELQHLISHRNMNSQIGEIFRACYRYGMASHSDMLRDAKKILFYAKAEVERLEGGDRSAANRPETRTDAVDRVVTDGGWIPWDGGVCPVNPESMVDVLYAVGIRRRRFANTVDWDVPKSSGARVVSYKVLEDA